ncbi:MAG: 50S ribosomal protein L31 [Actinobacteria bacterium]|nr:50S ribosomal protein L31 [Actinomycetota bacterium]MBU1493817.1 50S ribosomal protein L31 [Actinomycetota bacterium]MBU1865591.1 50S ribosomal protein L31 [Actinomycetota bacterium]
MRTDIHPEYGETTVTCSCGNTFVTRSTAKGDLHVELCNECHPFYTGKQKLVDSGGRVERFQRRYGRKSFTGEAAQAPEAGEASEAPAEA